MLKKKFIGPPIFLLAVVLFYLGTTVFFILNNPYLQHPGVFWLATTFFWPVVMIVEIVLYWRIRKINALRKASWAHVSLMAYAFASFFIKEWVFTLYDEYTPDMDISKFVRIGTLVHLILFWVAIVAAHIFFVRVLLKAAAKKHAQPNTDPNNLLDDVLG